MANRLADQTSPYLLQHANNPVDWYPWGPEALELAKTQDRPILLSIGYSACHWCHVMAHESFEDSKVAQVMNEHFVNIKVDREERPDLDKIYQTAHHLLTRNNGGWPLTMFLTPDQVPFFGGTYFPKNAWMGLPGFVDLLTRVATYYHDQRPAINDQNLALLDTLARIELKTSSDAELDSEPLNTARQQAANSFDQHHGGFGGAPKFPHPPQIERLMRHYAATAGQGAPDQDALHMVELTLTRMAEGGIYDQLGGGFCRYSVDSQWMIPHFEKMLYDNGPLLALYAQAWQLSGNSLYRNTATETADWVLRDMQSPEGGFYSSLDADSEGHEGRFYVWSREEIQALLNAGDYQVFSRRFGLNRDANFEGHWHLHVDQDLETIADDANLDIGTLSATIDRARSVLLEARNKRVWPGRDDKLLTSWNALMIKGLAIAGALLDRPNYLAAAERAVDFIANRMYRDGRLLATYKDGKAHLNAYLDDYAFLMDAILALLQARWRSSDLELLTALADALLADYEDCDSGGFWFTPHHHEQLIQRSKSWFDDAMPCGNGVAAAALNRLGHLLGETRYLQAAERTLQAAWSSIQGAPLGHNALLLALEEQLLPVETIIIRGHGAELRTWQQRATHNYAPGRQVIAIPSDCLDLPGLLKERVPRPDIIAYLCEGPVCQAPLTTLSALDQALSANETPSPEL
jgi:uncharacterized protein YyaL (SSP411 family)